MRALFRALLLLAAAFCTFAPAQVPAQAARYRLLLLRQAHGQWGLDAPVAALAAQVQQESNWNPQAVSRAGAQGMAQFMPATARWWCDLTGVAAADCLAHNPAWALRALVGYDLYLFNRAPAYLGDYDKLWLALRGYNGGQANWQAEARTIAAGPPQGDPAPLGGSATAAGVERGGHITGLPQPTREQIDAACGAARRAVSHCAENLAYPRRILIDLQPRYAAWGAVWEMRP
ncbi:MAG: transglycosylase SLT domain-containing protein [Desulfovibrionaceae bacterium]|nr:transglycosylase SLT domain-containing protein [Desulfovibrionaceae bacterium]